MRNTTSLMTGIAHCWCGRTVVAGRTTSGRMIYRCNPRGRPPDKAPFPHVARSQEEVDDYVDALLLAYFKRYGYDDLARSWQNSMANQEETAQQRREFVRLVFESLGGYITLAPASFDPAIEVLFPGPGEA